MAPDPAVQEEFREIRSMLRDLAGIASTNANHISEMSVAIKGLAQNVVMGRQEAVEQVKAEMKIVLGEAFQQFWIPLIIRMSIILGAFTLGGEILRMVVHLP